MVERYDETQNAMVEAELVERFDKPLNAWVDAESVQTYDESTASWVERWKQWITVHPSANILTGYDTVEADKTRLTAFFSRTTGTYISLNDKEVFFLLETAENDVLSFDYDKSAEGTIECCTAYEGKTFNFIPSGEATQGTYTYQCVSNGYYDFSEGIIIRLKRGSTDIYSDATVTITNVEIGGKAVRFEVNS